MTDNKLKEILIETYVILARSRVTNNRSFVKDVKGIELMRDIECAIVKMNDEN